MIHVSFDVLLLSTEFQTEPLGELQVIGYYITPKWVLDQ